MTGLGGAPPSESITVSAEAEAIRLLRATGVTPDRLAQLLEDTRRRALDVFADPASMRPRERLLVALSVEASAGELPEPSYAQCVATALAKSATAILTSEASRLRAILDDNTNPLVPAVSDFMDHVFPKRGR